MAKLDYTQLSLSDILEGKFENNKGYIKQYITDFRAVMGKEPCVSCGKKDQDYESFKQKLKAMSENKNSGFKLKSMYEGIPVSREFGAKDFVSNATLDDKKAEKLLKNHPLGAELFEKVPADFDLSPYSKEAKEKAEAEAKAKSEKEAKEKAEAEAKAKSEKEAKEKAEAEAKASKNK